MNKKTLSPFVRRRSVRAIVLLAIAVTATLASCSNDEMTDNPVETLPEGMYPLTFTATQGEVVATPQTRVSDSDVDGQHKSSWTAGDQIKVQIGNGTVGTYILNANGTINKQAQNNPAYWQSTAANQTITAWYPTTAADNYLKNQSSALPYVLKATGAAYGNATPQLQFKHQLAKFRFKLTGSAIKGGIYVPTVTVKGIAKTTYTNGEIEATSSATAEDIIPHKNGDYYEVLLLPGRVADNFIKIVVPYRGTYYYTPKAANNSQTNLTLEKANCYTYDIEVKEQAAKEIDLSSQQGETYTVPANTRVIIDGKGIESNKEIIINEYTDVTLKNVKIHYIEVQNTAILTLYGTNEINKTTIGSPLVVNGGTLTINGNLNDRLTLTAGDDYSGGGLSLENGANLIINGGTITATGVNGRWYGGAGIGANSTTCGTITINGGNITATGGRKSTGIGAGMYSSCGDIIITGGTISATGGGGNNTTGGAGIGSAAGYKPYDQSICGNITISGMNTQVTATAGSIECDDIGVGYDYSSCGTVTITDGATVKATNNRIHGR